MRRIKQGERPLAGRDRGTVRLLRWLRLPTLSRNSIPLPPLFGSDLRELGPVHVCPCGSQVFSIMASFEDHELVWYFLDGTCVSCGNLVTIPCPADVE